MPGAELRPESVRGFGILAIEFVLLIWIAREIELFCPAILAPPDEFPVAEPDGCAALVAVVRVISEQRAPRATRRP